MFSPSELKQRFDALNKNEKLAAAFTAGCVVFAIGCFFPWLGWFLHTSNAPKIEEKKPVVVAVKQELEPEPEMAPQPPLTDEQRKLQAEMKTAAGISLCAVLGFIGAAIFSIVIWTGPIWISMMRGHPDTAAIALLTGLLGWTCVCWWIALIWSVKSFPRDRHGRARDW
jgi:hypothetical protein